MACQKQASPLRFPRLRANDQPGILMGRGALRFIVSSLAAFFSLNILAIWPSYITLPSLIILALELFLISPSVTLEPATLPTLEEARTKIVGILRSPAQKIASILLAPASKIAILALEKSKK